MHFTTLGCLIHLLCAPPIIPPLTPLIEPMLPALIDNHATPNSDSIKLGSKAEGLKIIPPWTLRLCTIGTHEEIRAVYDEPDALRLRLIDADYMHLRRVVIEQSEVIDDVTEANKKLKVAFEKGQEALDLSKKRNKRLQEQVLKEIEEKNKYKYKPNYNWLWWTIAGTTALAGVVFGTTVWITKAE